MSDDESIIIDDQPLKVLGLFHKRELNVIKFDQQKLSRLYQILRCTICHNLLNNPVYLRCSHRFCKLCIQKYIRVSQNKFCPNCRGDLTTKRELRLDFDLTTLISFSFGDTKKFCLDLQEIQNAQIQSIALQKSHSKSSGIVRSKSFLEQQIKSVRKKIKLNDQDLNQNIINQKKQNNYVKIKKNYSNTQKISNTQKLVNLNTQRKSNIHSQKKQNIHSQKLQNIIIEGIKNFNYSRTQQLISYDFNHNINNLQQNKQKQKQIQKQRKYSNSQANIQINQSPQKKKNTQQFIDQSKINFSTRKKRGRKKKVHIIQDSEDQNQLNKLTQQKNQQNQLKQKKNQQNQLKQQKNLQNKLTQKKFQQNKLKQQKNQQNQLKQQKNQQNKLKQQKSQQNKLKQQKNQQNSKLKQSLKQLQRVFADQKITQNAKQIRNKGNINNNNNIIKLDKKNNDIQQLKKNKQQVKEQKKNKQQSKYKIQPLKQAQLLNRYLIQPVKLTTNSLQLQTSLLHGQFGNDYLFKLMKIPTLDFFISIKLERYSNSFITPLLNCKSIQISAKAKIRSLYELVAKLLNVNIKNVRVYTNQQQNIKQIKMQEYGHKPINWLNQQIWKTIDGVQVFDMKDILLSLQQTRMQNSMQRVNRSSNFSKVFQGMGCTQQKQLRILSKKRGRKSKKAQQRQNKDILKQQSKRILYYELFVC